MSVGTLGAILATWTYLPNDHPNYHKGHFINLGCECAAVVIGTLGVLYCRLENKKRANGDRDHRISGLTEAEGRKLGYRHPEFRYMD